MERITIGRRHEREFELTHDEVNRFMALSGDTNAIHSDAAAAQRSAIGQIAVPGMLSAMVFSRILGTEFPGHGTVYRSQSLEFRRPMFVGVPYVARVTVDQVFPDRHRARVRTEILDKSSGIVTLRGIAEIIHLELL